MQRQSIVTRVASGSNLIWVATYLPLRRWGNLPAFLKASSQVSGQLKKSPGAVRYGVKSDLLSKKFWTASAWASRAAMHVFVQTEPHLSAMARFEDWAGEGAAFVEWEAPDGPIDWKEISNRIPNPSFSTGRARTDMRYPK